MSTQPRLLDSAHWIVPSGEASGRQRVHEQDDSVTAVMSEFVELLKANPKVWAVCATEDSDGISVWTYIDSRDEPDLMAVFDAEWRLMQAHPNIAFGFNTFSVPVGGEKFDEDELDFLYRR